MRLDLEQQKQILFLKEMIVDSFDRHKWLELGLLTGFIDEVRGHPRLLRSWDFGDDDYSGHVLDMLVSMVTRDADNLNIIEDYVGGLSPDHPISILEGKKRVTFVPNVFEVPEGDIDQSLVAIMMPFDAAFDGVHAAIKSSCQKVGMSCQRVDDIWEHSTVIQDVFALIWRASIVVCDFTTRNANVFYECGIAHTLGKAVIPIAQHKSDVPFDLQHHRYLNYHGNSEGLETLGHDLQKRLHTLIAAR